MDKATRRALTSGWLQHVDEDLCDAILDAGRLTRLEDGERIYGFDDEQNYLYGVAEGNVRMVVTMNERAPFLGHIVGRGYWYGEHEIITGQGGLMEMTASGRTLVCAVSRSSLLTLADRHRGLWPAIALLANMAANIAKGVAEDLTLRDPDEKLAAVLLRLSSRRNAYQGAPPFDAIPVTQDELARVSGLSKSVVARSLAAFDRAGILRREYGRIRLLNPDALDRLLAD